MHNEDACLPYQLFEIGFQDLEKVAYWIWQNVHKVLKKYGNSKFSHLFIKILFFTTDDSSADVFCIVFYQ